MGTKIFGCFFFNLILYHSMDIKNLHGMVNLDLQLIHSIIWTIQSPRAKPTALRSLMVQLYSTDSLIPASWIWLYYWVLIFVKQRPFCCFSWLGCSCMWFTSYVFWLLCFTEDPKLFLSGLLCSCSWLVLSLLSYDCVHSLNSNSINTSLK